jgi:hypothetical protein
LHPTPNLKDQIPILRFQLSHNSVLLNSSLVWKNRKKLFGAKSGECGLNLTECARSPFIFKVLCTETYHDVEASYLRKGLFCPISQNIQIECLVHHLTLRNKF